jgi:hypothetical protein
MVRRGKLHLWLATRTSAVALLTASAACGGPGGQPTALTSVNELSNRCRIEALDRRRTAKPCHATFFELAARPEVFDGVNVRVTGYMGPASVDRTHRSLFLSAQDLPGLTRSMNGIVLNGDVRRALCLWMGSPEYEGAVPGVIVEGRFRRMAGYPDEEFLVGAIDVTRIDVASPSRQQPPPSCPPV